MDATLMKKADELADEFAGQATTLEELNEVMRSLMKTALERMLNTELDSHLGRVSSTGIQPPDETVAATGTDSATDAASGSSKARNRRNGTSPKTIQGDMGRLPLAILSFGSSKPATRSADLIGQNQPVRFRKFARDSLGTCRLIG